MARDATARLYDVDEDSLEFTKMRISEKYDQGTVVFSAKPGKLVDLHKLHESIWATRLSGGTRSGVVCLEVTTRGQVVLDGNKVVLQVANRPFVLVNDIRAKPKDAHPGQLEGLIQTVEKGSTNLRVTGYVEGWVGRWPTLLKKKPLQRPCLMVTAFEVEGENAQ